MTIGNIKFTQQPVIPAGTITSSTILPVVESSVNYQMTMGNLASYVNNSGNITGTTVSVSGNITGAYILGNGSQLTGLPATYANANVATYLASGNVTSNIITTGNVSGAYILGNGSQLTGIASSYGNANVAANLAAFGSNPISTSGNITAGYFAGNGSQLTGVTATLPANITGTSLSVTGNVTGNYILGNGSQLTGLPSGYANSNVSTYLASGNVTSNIITTGNVSGAYIIGNGSTLSNIAGANVSGTVANATYATSAGTATSATTATTATSATTATTAVTVTSASQPAITSVGTLTSLSVSGNVAGNYFIGNGSQLTGVVATSSNSTSVVASTFSPGTYNSSNVEIISSALNIPANTFTANSVMTVRHSWDSIANGNVYLKLYQNTSNSLSGANVLYTGHITMTGGRSYLKLQTNFDILATNYPGPTMSGFAIDTTANILGTGLTYFQNGFGAGATSGAYSGLANADWTQSQYIIFAVQQIGTSTANVARCLNASIYKE